MKKNNELRNLIIAALIVALEVVTVRLLPLSTYLPPGTFYVRFSLQTVWYALAGWILGPGWAMGAAMTADLLGATLNPTGNGVIFLGYTVTAALSGLCFGFFLHRCKPSLLRVVLAVAAQSLLIALPLSAYWGSVVGTAPVAFWLSFWPALPWRAAVVLPYTLVIYGLQRALQKTVNTL
ncbi:MAG: folate family ECF transporter S component [Oscillospiraceae bacterium]|jgi:ECF transporter S component (folate family)|nr:folate family ECF transporter S component [Oscillospiraceae bacterium]